MITDEKPTHYVIGVRAPDDHCILAEVSGRGRAEDLAEQMRRDLEEYSAIVVQPISSLPPPIFRSTKERTAMANETNLSNLKERHQMRQQEKPVPAPANGDGRPWAQLNRLEKAEMVRELVKEMGPDKGMADIMEAAERRGMTGLTRDNFRRWRQELGFPSLRGKHSKRPSQPQAKASPKQARAKQPAPVEEDDSPLVSLAELSRFAVAVKAIGGAQVARQVLEAMA